MESTALFALAVCGAAAAASILGGFIALWRGGVGPRVLAFGFAFAAGAMVYVSLVEILGKAQHSFGEVMSESDARRYAMLWFFLGVLLIILFERALPKAAQGPVDMPENTSRLAARHAGVLTALAIGAHNFPEGMATFFATLEDPKLGETLAIAIAIHNIPEGISVALPILYATGSRAKAMAATTLTALAEPMGGLIGYFIAGPFLSPMVFGAIFGTIAGSMVFLSLHELMPSARRHARGHETVYGLVLGMAMMAMSLVIAK